MPDVKAVAVDVSALQREVLEVSEREQLRIGQDLHDGLGQTLTAVACFTQRLHRKLVAGEALDPRETQEVLSLVNGAVEQARLLARGLTPVELKTHGLASALEDLAAAVRAKARIPCSVDNSGRDNAPDPAIAIQIYRIAQEAVSNAVKHAHPHSIRIALEARQDAVLLSVEDDGRGLPAPAEEGKGMGLHIMRYRAGVIGADFAVRPRKGGGTTVVCSWRKAGG